MRLNLTLTPSTNDVEYNHLHKLTGALHKWLGPKNRLHDEISLYSFGWLKGAQARNGSLRFPDGARWRLSFHDAATADRVQDGILKDPSVFAGMRVADVGVQAPPALGDRYLFKVDAPVLARKRRDDGSRAYLLYDDPASDPVLTRTLHAKMNAAGLDTGGSIRVRFDRGYDGARTKLATIHKGRHAVKHKGSLCPVIVEGSAEAVQFAWTVGVGDLTGSGFGAVK